MNILLICSAGMSTSLLVQKMRDAANEEGFEVTIWAAAEAEASDELRKADVVLLGPQIRFKLNQMKLMCGTTPIDVIDMRAYGMMDGKAVLHRAMEMVK